MSPESSTLFPLEILFFLLFLIGVFCLTAVGRALRRIYRRDPKSTIRELDSPFFYKYLHHYFFPKREFEGLFFATTSAQNIIRILFLGSFFLILNRFQLLPFIAPLELFPWGIFVLCIVLFVIFSFFLGDFMPRIIGSRYPHGTLKFCGPIASLFMILAFPFTYFFLKASLKMSHSAYSDYEQEAETQVREDIIEIMQDANVTTGLDAHEKKLIESVVSFRDRIAREVMVPRVKVFSLPADTSIREAARLLKAEGYSRTPVYKQNVDNIIGVLMYKDILNKYMEFEQKKCDESILEQPIDTIIKSVLYTPETKKISNLLQEFRKKQVHLAIVVDEYGGTEGLVTIEDILEEIVGEIADEYDEKEALYVQQPGGGWVVDTRLTILDAEELLGIEFPQEGDYDTIGGYIYSRTGSIPAKGFTIHHDNFNLEILSSNDRRVEKVRIIPTPNKKEDEAKSKSAE